MSKIRIGAWALKMPRNEMMGSGLHEEEAISNLSQSLYFQNSSLKTQNYLLFLPKSTHTMQNLTLLDGQKFQITIQRLCRQLIENHNDFSSSVLIGIQPRGIYLARRVAEELRKILPESKIMQGDL